MKKVCALLFVVLVLALPAAAGEKGKCTGSADDCLAKMTAKLQTKAWLGIEYETNDHGNWVVEEVYADSPAQKAGFEKGDVLLAIDDVKYSKDNKEALSAVYAGLKPGSSATYWVKTKRRKGEVGGDSRLGAEGSAGEVDQRTHGQRPPRVPDGFEVTPSCRRADLRPACNFSGSCGVIEI